MIIEILALSLAENSVIFRYNHLRRGDYSGRANFQNNRCKVFLHFNSVEKNTTSNPIVLNYYSPKWRLFHSGKRGSHNYQARQMMSIHYNRLALCQCVRRVHDFNERKCHSRNTKLWRYIPAKIQGLLSMFKFII